MRTSPPSRQTVRTRVTLDGPETYEAVLDPTDRWHGWVSPRFSLDTARQLAADTASQAEQHGHDSVDTIHVIEGGTDRDGRPRAVVMHIRWLYHDEGPEASVTVIAPDEDGLYGIGGWDWTWSIATRECACGEQLDHHVAPCPNCGRDRDDFALAA